jgi:hypothetical protein
MIKVHCFVLSNLSFSLAYRTINTKKAQKKTKRANKNEAPITPTKIGMVLE